MQSTYSWMGSPLHLILEDDFAAAFNRAQKNFFEAQFEYMERTHSQWTGVEPLNINWSPEERLAFDNIGRIINLLIEVNGGSLHISEEQMTSDYLEKI